jgi:hypothetical protein
MTILNRLLLILIAFSFAAMSQEGEEMTVYGLVLDEKTQAPITNSKVIIEKFYKGESALSMGAFKKVEEVVTGDSGCFSFTLSVDVNGKYQLTSKNKDKFWGGGILSVDGSIMSKSTIDKPLVIIHKQ